MNITVWALLPVAGMLLASITAVLIVLVALKGTVGRDRAMILKAVAEVVRSIRGNRT
ncbi:hypothetical protein OG613_48645 (plasmid) [Streptomyces sp. NBC_00015]|uniref:hypothetical protein n=1 Tax=Streptomyces sp. NBC_00015 TaxID=2903611 RepID=UPI002F9170C0